MSRSAPMRAAIWMLGSIVSFSAMAVAGRELSSYHDTFEIMTYRSLLGLIIVLCIAKWAGTLGEIKRNRIGIHAIRNVCHFTGQNLWFFAITAAPLAQVFALEFTTPIWATLLAPFVLGERLTRIRAFAAALGFTGILIVAQPGAGVVIGPGLIAAALAAICFAGTALSTRFLTRTETITCIMFFLTAMQAVFGLITAGIDGDIALPTLNTLPWLVLVACAGLVAHFCMTKALSLAPAGVVMPIDFARLPIIAMVGMLFYAEPLQWAVLIGAVIIFTANYINIRSETRNAPVN